MGTQPKARKPLFIDPLHNRLTKDIVSSLSIKNQTNRKWCKCIFLDSSIDKLYKFTSSKLINLSLSSTYHTQLRLTETLYLVFGYPPGLECLSRFNFQLYPLLLLVILFLCLICCAEVLSFYQL